jgi:hypothetical protein
MRRRMSGFNAAHFGGLKAFAAQELDGRFLLCARNELKSHAGLADVLLLGVVPADDGGDVVHLECPLAEQPAVDLLEIREWLPGPRRGSRDQHRRNALEVLHTERG